MVLHTGVFACIELQLYFTQYIATCIISTFACAQIYIDVYQLFSFCDSFSTARSRNEHECKILQVQRWVGMDLMHRTPKTKGQWKSE